MNTRNSKSSGGTSRPKPHFKNKSKRDTHKKNTKPASEKPVSPKGRNGMKNQPKSSRGLKQRTLRKRNSRPETLNEFGVNQQNRVEQVRQTVDGSRYPMPDPVNRWGNESIFKRLMKIGSVVLIFVMPLMLYAFRDYLVYYAHVTFFSCIFYGHNMWLLTIMFGHFIVQCIFTRFKRFGYIAYHEDGYRNPLCFNGYIITFFLTGIFLICDHYGLYFNSSLFIFHTPRVIASTFAAALSQGALLWHISYYTCSSHPNKKARNRIFLSGFWIGRELQPHYFKTDLKLAMSRYRNVTSLVLVLSYLKYAIDWFIWTEFDLPHVTYITSLVMQLIYLSLSIFKEEKIMATYYWNYEGFGCMAILANEMFPYLFFFLNGFLLHKNTELKIPQLLFIVTVFLIGIGVYIWSYKYKNVRQCGGRRPLEVCIKNARGPWRFVRHPDYFAEILIHCSFAMPAFIYNKLYTIPSFIIMLCIMYVVWCNEKHCKTRYRYWDRYKRKTPNMIIPGFF